ncbi:MAG: DUF4422 domain-containing protein [Coriobacteriaceae bacterium]|uniref:DUF4422 domain-containing protein n=1 Tax=Tractidigestivibacter sp. TaxID=2847320 RepID=UPI002A81057E|nr:DUF4422 domain-containing protein [Tractidigestivibacter sp.]MCI6843867.1 DUF4422 domain-containing protein [Coriobacteriaceae bacterium]MCI7438508.1 DUF4422 domain-containing protein [Coriobacteriaceae bacterium]MDY4535275.1 DUF4422 domain-containing protein [Tractidigestivibacter sp.]MDY5272493.1 DUF4422 domain-containing protein [Tractidigestivibacter sp.]
MNQMVVAVATHKPYKMPGDPIYLPLHVGAGLHPDILPNMQGDNTGDNISTLNASYSELTGLYWLWKNCDAHYKGLVHYRRLLGSADKTRQRQKDPYERLVDGPELLSLLSDRDVVLAKRRNYYIETVYDHYSHTLDGSQLDKTRSVIEGSCPEYLSAWDNLMKSTRVHVFNMFVMPSTLFDAYCAWLFPLLGELGQRIGTSDMDPFAARWPGRVSERMLDPWLVTNGISYAELPVVSPESVDWLKKGSSFLAAKFLGKKYERSF